jgi:hypothetical protein
VAAAGIGRAIEIASPVDDKGILWFGAIGAVAAALRAELVQRLFGCRRRPIAALPASRRCRPSRGEREQSSEKQMLQDAADLPIFITAPSPYAFFRDRRRAPTLLLRSYDPITS